MKDIYTSYLTMINQIFITANVIITFLDNLDNSINFRKLHFIHSINLTTKHLQFLIEELNHITKKNILNLDIKSW